MEIFQDNPYFILFEMQIYILFSINVNVTKIDSEIINITWKTI